MFRGVFRLHWPLDERLWGRGLKWAVKLFYEELIRGFEGDSVPFWFELKKKFSSLMVIFFLLSFSIAYTYRHTNTHTRTHAFSKTMFSSPQRSPTPHIKPHTITRRREK